MRNTTPDYIKKISHAKPSPYPYDDFELDLSKGPFGELTNRLKEARVSERPSLLKNVYKQLAISNNGGRTKGTFRDYIENDPSIAEVFAYGVGYELDKYGLHNHAKILREQYDVDRSPAKKSLMGRITASGIVVKTGHSSTPEFYSARGATTTDLNSKLLEKFYNGIKRNIGKDAGKEFVKMVADIPKLSMTDFLLTLYELERNNWKWDRGMLGNANGIYLSGSSDEARDATSFATIAGVMSGMSSRDETPYIRGQFLRNHGVEESKSEIKEDRWWGLEFLK
jgi:hypothetical protein